MEAIKRYVSADQLAGIMSLPQSFIGKKLEVIIMPSEDPSELNELLASIKGPVPDNTLTLEGMREERWKAYEDLT